MRENLRYKILFLSFAVLLFPLKGLPPDKTSALLIIVSSTGAILNHIHLNLR